MKLARAPASKKNVRQPDNPATAEPFWGLLRNPGKAVFAEKTQEKNKSSPVLEREPLKRLMNSGNESAAPLDSRLAE